LRIAYFFLFPLFTSVGPVGDGLGSSLGGGTPYAGAVIMPASGSGGGGAASTATVSGGTGTPYAGAGRLSVVFPQPEIAVAPANRIAARVSGRPSGWRTSAGSNVAVVPQKGHPASVVRM